MHTLPLLTYKYTDFEPYFDAATMQLHYSKHHQAYVDKLNEALEGNVELQKLDISILLKSLNDIPEAIRTKIKNFGGGHYNHSFFWDVITANSTQKPEGQIGEVINKTYGNYDDFVVEFTKSALSLFGSGWTWLVIDKSNKLSIINTSNQDCPISIGLTPLLALDLWEHAYYLKYQNRRKDFIDVFYNVINWEKVNTLYLETLKSYDKIKV